MGGTDCHDDETPRPIFRDIRRYCCEYCGICRSKKLLIVAHMKSQHKEELEKEEVGTDDNCETKQSNTCEKCGATFKKPAYLKQHMQSHLLEYCLRYYICGDVARSIGSQHRTPKCVRLFLLRSWMDQYQVGRPPEKLLQDSLRSRAFLFERPFICSVEDCSASYRRKDHLTRHALQHEGKLFTCPLDGCKTSFTIKSNLKRHLNNIHHHETPPSPNPKTPKEHVCPEEGCGKVFKYASQLRKHEDSHVKLESMEAICAECLETFSNIDCLKAHILSSHQHTTCEICGSNQLRKHLKRHLRTHEKKGPSDSEVIKCHFPDCDRTFSSESNLRTHVKAVHLELKPYVCCHPDCGKRFSYRHVRDHHEKTGCHVYSPGDFVEADEQFQARPRGGRKRKMPLIESLLRKRVCLDLNFLSD